MVCLWPIGEDLPSIFSPLVSQHFCSQLRVSSFIRIKFHLLQLLWGFNYENRVEDQCFLLDPLSFLLFFKIVVLGSSLLRMSVVGFVKKGLSFLQKGLSLENKGINNCNPLFSCTAEEFVENVRRRWNRVVLGFFLEGGYCESYGGKERLKNNFFFKKVLIIFYCISSYKCH